MAGHGVNENFHAPDDGHSSGAMLLSMLKKRAHPHAELHTSAAERQHASSHGFVDSNACTIVTSGDTPLNINDSATQACLQQPRTPWGAHAQCTIAQNSSSIGGDRFSFHQQQHQQEQAPPPDLQPSFGGMVERQGDMQQASSVVAATTKGSHANITQPWQQLLFSQPLFAAPTDLMLEQQQRAPAQQQFGQLDLPLFDQSRSPNHGHPAAMLPGHPGMPGSIKGPPPGFPAQNAYVMEGSQQPAHQQNQPVQYWSNHLQPANMFSLVAEQQQAMTAKNGEAGIPHPPYPWPPSEGQLRQQHQDKLEHPYLQPTSEQFHPQALDPHSVRQQPADGLFSQSSQLAMFKDQREREQQQVPASNLSALFAQLHLQHQQVHPAAQQQQQQQHMLQQLIQDSPPLAQQQWAPQAGQEPSHKPTHFESLLAKLQTGTVVTQASVSHPSTAVAAPVSSNEHLQAAAILSGRPGISIPERSHAAGVLSDGIHGASTAAAAAAAEAGSLAPAKSSYAAIPGNFMPTGQLSSSAPAGQGVVHASRQQVSDGLRRVTPRAPPPIRLSMQALNQQLVALTKQLAPTVVQRQRQTTAWAALGRLLQQLWPQGRLHLFGSVANGLDVGNSNDLDVCLELEGVDETREARGEVITELGQQLETAGMENVLALPRARMPVVKFELPDTGFKVDITINNRLAVVNTKFLRDYSSLDPRLRCLVLLVKHWAKRRQCNAAYVGTLSSYAYVLLCIAHLQTRSPPVLPVLQELTPFTHQRTISGWCCDYNDDIQSLAGFGSGNTETLGELLISFFYHWAHQHDYKKGVVSIRTSRAVTKEMKGWTTRVGMERHLFCIEDPFELSHDLGRTVHAEGCSKLRNEFRRAWDICQRSSSPEQLIQELFAEAPAAAAVSPTGTPATAAARPVSAGTVS